MPMIKTFTKHDVVRELYSETSAQEKENLLIARLTNPSLSDEWDDMLDLQSDLDKAMLQPPSRVTDAILQAARW